MAIFLCIDAISSQNMRLGARCLSRPQPQRNCQMHVHRFDGAKGRCRTGRTLGDVDTWIPVDALNWAHCVHLPVNRAGLQLLRSRFLSRCANFSGQKRPGRGIQIGGGACQQAVKVVRSPDVGQSIASLCPSEVSGQRCGFELSGTKTSNGLVRVIFMW
jgi:hypothetical protein